MAQVAKSGDYNDLENTPDIPSIEGLASETFVGNAISTHNTSSQSHQDIRDAIPSVEGLASETFVGNAVSSHNVANDSHSDIRTSVSTINGKIPEQASTSNQLADKNFVNSSVATNTAYFLATLDIIDDLHLTYDATMLQVVAALNDYEFTSVKTNNDYCNVITQDNVGNILFERFKWNSQEDTFKYEFSLNNSSFTAVQWASINSNATAENIAQIALNALAISTLQSDVAGKVSKSGDTISGELDLTGGILKLQASDENVINFESGNAVKWRFWKPSTDGSLYLQKYSSPSWLSVIKFQSGYDILFRSDVYVGGVSSSTAKKLATEEFVSTNYLPLAGGTMTGDINMGEKGILFKDPSSTYRHRIIDEAGVFRVQRSSNGTTWNNVASFYGATANVVGLGEMRAQATTLSTDDTLTRRAHIYKQGVVSQTQTWTGSASTGYSYTMSNPVTGNIPISFIELVEELGATFNETSGYFELNGLTDISYKEMKAIYRQTNRLISSTIWDAACQYTTDVRTNFGRFNTTHNMGGSGSTYGPYSLGSFAQYSNLEVFAISPEYKGINEKSTTKFTYVRDFFRLVATDRYVKKIVGTIYANSTLAASYFSSMFDQCYSLEEVYIMKIYRDLSFSHSSKLKFDCVQFLVDNANNSTAITITLHPTTYATAQADTTEYTYSGNTYVGIISYAAARNITIQSA